MCNNAVLTHLLLLAMMLLSVATEVFESFRAMTAIRREQMGDFGRASMFPIPQVGIGGSVFRGAHLLRDSHSLDIPTSRHFCSRQYWQRLRVTLLMMQFFSR